MTLLNRIRFLPVLQMAALLAFGCGICMPAHADSAVSYRLGTFGVGLDYGVRIYDTMTMRLGYNFYVLGQTGDRSGVEYDAKLKISAPSLLMDLHHVDSPWRLTLGVSGAGPRIEAQGTAIGPVTFNGNTYAADQVGNLHLRVKPTNPVAPYVGIGYGQAVGPTDRFTFLADLGVLYVGAPVSEVDASCGAALTGTECDQLLADVQAEANMREENRRNLQWWPVLSIGFAMRW